MILDPSQHKITSLLNFLWKKKNKKTEGTVLDRGGVAFSQYWIGQLCYQESKQLAVFYCLNHTAVIIGWM